ncbi:MAG: glycoside hydrolase family 3 C-terminal domain-containing protein [Acidobacteria bacterium]|jgi:beta-N-acetylhexosaminidase|nr:glycoside hydrolase family 3 C-terminal domain-containing protein [Acidobacteriota bacterium]
MKKLTILLTLFCLLSLCVSSSLFAQNIKFRPSEKAQKWAEKQLKKMSVDEKIGQLVHVGINARFLNQSSPEFLELKRQVVDNKVGGIIVFVGGVYETVHLMNRMQELARMPLLISSDFETGVAMRFTDTTNFPWNMAIAATGNPEFARREGVIAAREARALGVQWAFAPTVDVNNNADNPVINVRSYGENPLDVSRFAVAFTQGLQSGNVLATAKHFPGHGDTAVDSHRGLPIINLPRSRLDQIELAPFKSVIDGGIGSVMISHISLPQIDATKVEPLKKSIKASYTESEVINENTTLPATLSPNVVTQMLQKDLNFDGLIVTDAMDMSGLTLYFNQDEAAVRAILAGADVLLKPASADVAIRGLKEAVGNGRISEQRLNHSVRKVLAWKHHLGLDEQKITPLEQIDKTVSADETRLLSNEIADNAITLVKSEESVLPLKKDRKVFLFGVTNGEDRNFVANTFQRTLRLAGINVEAIILDERSTETEMNEARKKASEADVILAGLFGRVRSGAKNSVGIPEAGAKVLREFLSSDKKIVSISFGNPYLLSNFPEMKTYVVAYGDMPSLQRATARALVGEIDFKGKLPISLNEKYRRGTGLSLK